MLVGLDWIGLGGAGLVWVGLGRTELDWAFAACLLRLRFGLACINLIGCVRIGFGWTGLGRIEVIGLDRVGIYLTGPEWDGVDLGSTISGWIGVDWVGWDWASWTAIRMDGG